MIKNAFIYTAKFSGTINRNELNRITAGCPFVECQPTQHKSAGFVPPRQGGEMVEWIDDNVIMDIRIDTRKVPAEAVRKEVDRMAALIEDQTGRKPGKKQRKELSAQAEHELMPKAFTKTAVVRVWISLAHGFAVLGTGSQGVADEIMTSLAVMFDGIANFGVVQTQMSPTAAANATMRMRYPGLHSRRHQSNVATLMPAPHCLAGSVSAFESSTDSPTSYLMPPLNGPSPTALTSL